jgi:RHS repeat-associated protein
MLGANPANAATSLLYTGEMYDSSASMYYLRARWYDQQTGRFNRMDPFAGNNQDPQSLHKYLYCHANPVNGIDPSGQLSVPFTYGELMFVAKIIGAIVGAIAGGYIAHRRGLSITETEFWCWVAGGTLVGVTIATIAVWALVKFGIVTVVGGGPLIGGASQNINWLCDSADKAYKICRPDHHWNYVVDSMPTVTPQNAPQVYNTQVLPVCQRVVDSCASPQAQTLANGAHKMIYTGVVNGYDVIVQIWVSPIGQLVVENAWVGGSSG